MEQIPNGFYRISAKALILDENKKFLLIKEQKGRELPGGGLEYGESPQECIKRELFEEMGIDVKCIKDTPSYFVTIQKPNGVRIANIIYEVQVDVDKIFNFKTSDECLEAKFFDIDEAKNENLFPNVRKFIRYFNPGNH